MASKPVRLTVSKSLSRAGKLSLATPGESLRDLVTEAFKEGDIVELVLHARDGVEVGQRRIFKGLNSTYGIPHPSEGKGFTVEKILSNGHVTGRYWEGPLDRCFLFVEDVLKDSVVVD